MENVVTGFVFLSDIDFLPGVDTYASLKKSVHAFYDVDIPGNSIKPKLVGERYFHILLNALQPAQNNKGITLDNSVLFCTPF